MSYVGHGLDSQEKAVAAMHALSRPLLHRDLKVGYSFESRYVLTSCRSKMSSLSLAPPHHLQNDLHLSYLNFVILVLRPTPLRVRLLLSSKLIRYYWI